MEKDESVDFQDEQQEEETEDLLEEDQDQYGDDTDWEAVAKEKTAVNERLKKKLEALKTQPEKKAETLSKPSVDEEVTERLSRLELSDKKRHFGHEHGLSPAETDHVFAFVGKDDPAKALENPFVKAGLEAMRSQAKAEQAVPDVSRSAPKIKGKTWDKMDEGEKKTNYQEFMASKLRK